MRLKEAVMNEIIYLFLGCSAGIIAAWFGVSFLEEKKHFKKSQILENKVQFSQSQIFQLNSQLAKVQSEADVLRRDLETERTSKLEAVTQVQQSLRKSRLVAGIVSLAVGLLAGGGTGWFLSGTAAEVRYLRQTHQLEMTASLATLKSDLLEKQFTKLQFDYDQLHKNWQNLFEERTVALAKLETVLKEDSFSSAKDLPKPETPRAGHNPFWPLSFSKA